MTKKYSEIISPQNDGSVIAHIDCLDEAYILPIREFLLGFGCEVVINQPSKLPTRYHLIIGDGAYVQSIFAHDKCPKTKHLAIIWDDTELPDILSLKKLQLKVIYAKLQVLSSRNLEKIFAFFITGSGDILNLSNGSIQKPKEKSLNINQDLSTVISQIKKDNYHGIKKTDKEELIADAPDDAQNQEKKLQDDIERIEQTVSSLFKSKKRADTKHKVQQTKKQSKKKKKSFVTYLWLGLSLTLLPFLSYVSLVTAGGLATYYSAAYLVNGNESLSRTLNKTGAPFLEGAKLILYVIRDPVVFLGYDSAIRGQERLLSFLADVAEAELHSFTLLNYGKRIASQFFQNDQPTGKGEISLAANLERFKNELSYVGNRIGLARAQLKLLYQEPVLPFSLSLVRDKVLAAGTKLQDFEETIVFVDNLLTIYPKFSGFAEKKTYLMLLQNSMELRPTGGFIGSLAVVSFEGGKLVDFVIQDVYAVDGQLKGHVDPPGPIREILGEIHWYLRDSNWQPDFSKAAQQAIWFYEKETGATVDGVIGISTPVIVDILKAIGPIELPEYSDRITADNFFGKSLYYTQVDFFPGSTQKKDFLGSLARVLIEKLTDSRALSQKAFYQIARQAFDRHDIMFFFSDSQVQAVADHYGWTGKVPAVAFCQGYTDGEVCFSDFLYAPEANLGVNKVNFFLRRKKLHEVRLSESRLVEHTVTYKYKNSSFGSTGEGGGSYRAYMQLIIPKDVRDLSVVLDAKPLGFREAKNLKTPPIPYLERLGEQNELVLYGIAFEVGAGQEEDLVISYKRNSTLKGKQFPWDLELHDQKQPGAVYDESQIVISYPIYWIPEDLPVDKNGISMQSAKQSFLAKEAQLEYNTLGDKDSHIYLRFEK